MPPTPSSHRRRTVRAYCANRAARRIRLFLTFIVLLAFGGASVSTAQQLYRSSNATAVGPAEGTLEGTEADDTSRLLVELSSADHLPIGFLLPVARSLKVRPHEFLDLAMAFYQPGFEVEEQAADSTASGTEPPDWRPGTLFLRRDVYFEGDSAPDTEGVLTLRPIVALPLDAVEYLMHALTLAYFERTLAAEAPSTSPSASSPSKTVTLWLQSSAAELVPDVPAQAGLDYYISAVASFASHQIALRNEIERTYRRRQTGEARKRFCSALTDNLAMFSTWRKSFGEMSFTGYSDLPAGQRPPELRRQDKQATLDRILAIDWSGDPQTDLKPFYCVALPGKSRGAPR